MNDMKPKATSNASIDKAIAERREIAAKWGKAPGFIPSEQESKLCDALEVAVKALPAYCNCGYDGKTLVTCHACDTLAEIEKILEVTK